MTLRARLHNLPRVVHDTTIVMLVHHNTRYIDDHVAKLKLNIPPFEGRYNPDAYLTGELEVEQHFACLRYPEDKRVNAATCEFSYLLPFGGLNIVACIMLMFLLLVVL
jgi:hypothetical protein